MFSESLEAEVEVEVEAEAGEHSGFRATWVYIVQARTTS